MVSALASSSGTFPQISELLSVGSYGTVQLVALGSSFATCLATQRVTLSQPTVPGWYASSPEPMMNLATR
eukprot:4171610-Prymnesium_polylepis.1